MPQPSVWISAAETSGDIHGAQLVESLHSLIPSAEFLGVGGPAMRDRGLKAVVRSEELSVMGLTEVLSALPRILSIYRQIKHRLRTSPPDCLVLIDAPDFHFRVAKMASKLNIPVYYYISPQVWAWRKRRVHFLKKHVRKILCIIPFEKDFYVRHGVDVEYVGHPLMQHLDFQALEQVQTRKGLIGIMPGSRAKEIRALLPAFADAARQIKADRPEIAFRLFQSAAIEESELRNLWPDDLPVEVAPFEQRYRHMKACQVIITASGTATLECALLDTPAIVAYRISRLSYCIARLLVDVPFISMPNLILDRQVFPEFLQNQVTGQQLARQALDWLNEPDRLDQVRSELSRLRSLLGQETASRRSAEIIVEDIRSLPESSSFAGAATDQGEHGQKQA